MIAAFRRPLSEKWTRRFWRSLQGDPGQLQKQTAALLGVPASNVSNESEPGTPVLLTYLFGTRQSWKSLPELHWNRCLATQCYRAAVEEARERFDRHMDGRQQGESLSDVDFELLLRLYQCDDWFRHLKAELALGEADKGPHRAARNLLASAICEDAEPNVKLPAEFERTASSLQSLQEEWGIPWMLAIEVLPYRWDLHS